MATLSAGPEPARANLQGTNLTSDKHTGVNRACESCRLLKVRCLPTSDASSSNCQRCTKAGRACLYAAPQKRRQRKRTDTRVAELEREVRAMRLLLSKSGHSKSETIPEQDEPGESEDDDCYEDICAQLHPFPDEPGEGSENTPPMDNSRMSKNLAAPPLELLQEFIPNVKANSPGPALDVIDRGILTMATATELFNMYNSNLIPHYPMVLSTLSAEETRKKKPTLFLAMLAASAGKADTALYETLHDEILRVYADRIIIRGDKSLELVQSMLLTAVWHYPPADFQKLKFYQYIHMAATMALDLGLATPVGSRQAETRPSLPKKKSDDSLGAESSNSPGSQRATFPGDMSAAGRSTFSGRIECRRTFLSCYLLCAAVAMSLRRPNMLRFTAWMSNCVEFLEKSPQSVFSDKRLAARVRLQHIADECGTSFAFDDPSVEITLSNPRMQLTLKGFEKRLDEWKKSLEPGIMNVSLAIDFHQYSIFLHEFAMHGDHNPEDFKSPYLLDRNSSHIRISESMSPTYIDAIMACIDSAHSLLDAFLSMDLEMMREVPVIVYVRMSYSIVVLIKISGSAMTPTSELSKIMDVASLKVDLYLDALIEKIKLAVEPRTYVIPAKFLHIIVQLQRWYKLTQPQNSSAQGHGQQDLMEPLLHLKVDREKESWSTSKPGLDAKATYLTVDDIFSYTRGDAPTNPSTSSASTSTMSEPTTKYFPLDNPQQQRANTYESQQLNYMAPLPPNLNPPNLDYPMDVDMEFFSSFIDSSNSGIYGWISDDNMGGDYNYDSSGIDWNLANLRPQ